ncbi:CBS domain-containing protein [Streptomyces xantholiticus]
MTQQVREVMTTEPVTVDPDTSVQQVAARMRDENIGAVLVIDSGQLRGLVTDRDLTVRILVDSRDVSARTVGEACSGEVMAVAPDGDVERAVQLMRSKALHRLPVIDDGQPVGIISLSDLTVERDQDSAPGAISAAEPNV